MAYDSAALERLIASGSIPEAVATVERHAAAGDADALFQLATWRLIGDPLPRDLSLAVRLFGDARALGHADAALAEIALTANGSAGDADWASARMLLDAASPSDDIDRSRLLLDRMALTDDGRPTALPEPEVLSTAPDVRRYPGLLTADECRWVANSAYRMLEPAVVVDPVSGRATPHPVRTSWAAVIGPTRENLVVRAINLRLAALTGTDVRQGEALTVLRYDVGQQFRPHLDALPGATNQRVMTVLLYLNDDFAGGETGFPAAGLTITPRQGDAIVFGNVRPDGSPDPDAKHSGEPVTRGVKWLATRWIRARPFDMWRGPDQPVS